MNYLSVCFGIEAATVAWHHMGWKPVGFSEIEKFPSQVLAHHYPQVTNFGDMTKYKEWQINDPIGLLVGGTPCQSFSVAGLRKGLEDPRGNLALTYVGILDHFRPKWFIWENVPGVLSDASECLLSDTLEIGNLPQKYYLSPRACQGILRRAEKRGKKLPENLYQALLTVSKQLVTTT